MARKDVSDQQVVQAFVDMKACGCAEFADAILMRRTGQCEKVVYAAMERSYDRGLIECGVSLRSGWPTPKGLELLGSVRFPAFGVGPGARSGEQQ